MLSFAVLACLGAAYFASWYFWLQEISAFTEAYESPDYLEAQRHIKSCLWLSSIRATKDLRYLKSLQFRAALFSVRRDFAQAESLFRQTIAIAETDYGPESSELATQKSLLALVLRKTGRYAEAEKLYRQVLVIQEKQPSPSMPKAKEVAETLDYLAWTLIKEEKFAEAEAILERCLAITESEYGADSFKLISPRVEQAYLYNEQDGWQKARPILDNVLEFCQKQKPGTKTSAYTVVALLTMANLFRDHACSQEAEYAYKLALEGCKQNVAGRENNLFMTDILISYAKLLDNLARTKEADSLKVEAENIRQRPALDRS